MSSQWKLEGGVGSGIYSAIIAIIASDKTTTMVYWQFGIKQTSALLIRKLFNYIPDSVATRSIKLSDTISQSF